jgi:ABC-type transport system involved in multi-copper enzyme maturation permease subunit
MSIDPTLARWITVAVGGAVLLLGLAIAVYLLAGLFSARSLIRREFSAYFVSPLGYVVLTVFLLVTGLFFYLTVGLLTKSDSSTFYYLSTWLLPTNESRDVEFPLTVMLGHWVFWLVFLFIPPLLTMRLFAEERATGTLEVLLTSPLRDWQIVLSKYLACFAFYVFLWLPTLVYLPVLLDMQVPQWQQAWTIYSSLLVGGIGALVVAAILALLPLGTASRVVTLFLLVAGAACIGFGAWGHYTYDSTHLLTWEPGEDQKPILLAYLSSYLGLVLAGAMFLAIGLLISSLVRSQIVAAFLSLMIGLVFLVGGFRLPEAQPGSPLYRVLYFFSVPLHFSQDFARGLVDTRHLVLYTSVTLFCLFLTVRSLESRRSW